MPKSSKPSLSDDYNALRFKGTPPQEAEEELRKLDEDLKNYSRDFFGYLFSGKDDHYDNTNDRYQFTLYHISRLRSSGIKSVFGASDNDAVKVLRKARDKLKEHYEDEESHDYFAQLMDHLDRFYKEGHIGVYSSDRKERLEKENRTYWPGERYRVSIELHRDSEEYKNCKSKPWVFAQGWGRNTNRAALDTFRMLKVKEEKGLLWVNENIRKKYEYPKSRRGKLFEDELNYFDEKDLKKMKKQMEEDGIPAQPPSCLKPESETLVKKTDSTHSLKSIWSRTTSGSPAGSQSNSPLPSPIREMTSFLGGSVSSIFPRRDDRDSFKVASQNTSGTTTPTSHSGHALPEMHNSHISRIGKSMSKTVDSAKSKGKGKEAAQRTGEGPAAESSRNAGTAAKPRQKQRTGEQHGSVPASANKDAEKDTKTKEGGKK